MAEIRLQRDQHAVFEGYFDQENLSVVTEANSILELYDIRVDYLDVTTEGESQVYIDNYHEILEDETVFENERVVEIGDNLLLIDDTYWVYGNSIEFDEENEEWTVFGDDIHSVFRMLSMDFKTEGNSYIDAANAPADYVSINLEGDSEAAIWATEVIEGKGEGSSTLHYADVPGLDMTGFRLEGSAAAVPFFWYEDWD